MFDRHSILSFLDTAFQNIEMPCLGNVNIDYVSSRLLAYRNTDQWLLLFNSVVWSPAAAGLMAMVEMVGTGVVGRQGYDADRTFVPGCIELDDEENIVRILVRGEAIDPVGLAIKPDYSVQPEYGFWISVALVEKYRESLLASATEIKQFIPPGFQPLLTVDEWDHPTWDRLPSRTVSFPQIANVLVASDPSIWIPVAAPNIHWSHWLPK